jgi:predicted Zn finger-like uncharacterized protein
MPIQFHCPNCQQQLRVDDSAAGKKAKCPKCETIVAVPLASGGAEQPPEGAPEGSPFGGAPPTQDGPEINPYTSPAPAAGMAPGGIGATGAAIQRRPLDIGGVMSHAWEVWQKNLGLLVGGFLVIMLISGVVVGPFTALRVNFEMQGEREMAAVIGLIGNIINQIVSTYLGIGYAQLCLKLARGQQADFAQIFAGGSRFLPVLAVSILMGLAIGLGFLACIVPGIILALMWWPAYYLVVDEKADIIESFSVAARITKENWGSAFALWFVSAGIMILGLLALCVGFLFAAPLVAMMWISAYLMISGQLNPVTKPPAY